MLVGVLDLGLGNVKSVYNMLRYLRIPSRILKLEESINKSTHLILPGVGNFDAVMQKLLSNKCILEEAVFHRKIRFLGICVGFQVLFDNSEEGNLPGLGWINGNVEKLKTDILPHIGWNQVFANKSVLLHTLNKPRFYFIHSYAVYSAENVKVATTEYCGIEFISLIEYNNLYGVQFHPEKSHKYGMQLFKNFVGIK